MKRLALAFVGAVLALGVVQSCSRSGTSTTASPETTAWTSLTPAKAMELSLVDRMFVAPKNVLHGGVRHVVYDLPTPGGVQRLEYLERVVADGHGQFSITPVSVVSPAMTTAQRETFELIQKQREGFFFNYRDFGIRDRELFGTNYRVVTVPTVTSFLGRDCIELEIRRRDEAATWYLALVDSKTGLVMRCVEYTTAGSILSRTEFTEFTLEPDLEGVEWHETRYAPETTPLTPASISALGFVPAEPRLLPVGFQHLSSDVVTAEGESWVRRVYGDGVESLFVLHRRRTEPGLLEASSDTSSLRMGSASSPVASGAPSTVTVRLCQVGPWTMAEATRGLERIFVVGKVAEAEVVRVLQSTL